MLKKMLLATVALGFSGFALVSSFVLPRRYPDFPGRWRNVYLLVSVAFFAAMLSAVVVFGRESKGKAEAATGTTPLQWLLIQRVRRAQQLLESSDQPVERIASLAGFGTAANLRQHFTRVVGVPPMHYRRTFRGEQQMPA